MPRAKELNTNFYFKQEIWFCLDLIRILFLSSFFLKWADRILHYLEKISLQELFKPLGTHSAATKTGFFLKQGRKLCLVLTLGSFLGLHFSSFPFFFFLSSTTESVKQSKGWCVQQLEHSWMQVLGKKFPRIIAAEMSLRGEVSLTWQLSLIVSLPACGHPQCSPGKANKETAGKKGI